MPLPMQAGKLRHRIEIQSRVLAQDGYGDPLPTWTTQATRWGQILPQSAQEVWRAQQAQPEVTHVVRMRFYDGLTPDFRLKIGTRIFNIAGVTDTEERHREHVITCREEV